MTTEDRNGTARRAKVRPTTDVPMATQPAPADRRRPRAPRRSPKSKPPLMLEESEGTGLLVYTGPIPEHLRGVPVGDLLYSDEDV